MTITITLPDGSTREHEQGVTAGEIAASIGAGLAKAALSAKVDGEWYDLGRPIDHDAEVAIITPASDDGREVLRHSTAHVMAQAVSDLFPGAKYAIGPAIADGFYYDFDLPGGQHFSDDDLASAVLSGGTDTTAPGVLRELGALLGIDLDRKLASER